MCAARLGFVSALYYPLVSGVILQTCRGSFSSTSDVVPFHTPYGFIALRCALGCAALGECSAFCSRPIGAARGGRARGGGGAGTDSLRI